MSNERGKSTNEETTPPVVTIRETIDCIRIIVCQSMTTTRLVTENLGDVTQTIGGTVHGTVHGERYCCIARARVALSMVIISSRETFSSGFWVNPIEFDVNNEEKISVYIVQNPQQINLYGSRYFERTSHKSSLNKPNIPFDADWCGELKLQLSPRSDRWFSRS